MTQQNNNYHELGQDELIELIKTGKRKFFIADAGNDYANFEILIAKLKTLPNDEIDHTEKITRETRSGKRHISSYGNFEYTIEELDHKND